MGTCPHCSAEVPGPIISYAPGMGQNFRTTKDCTECGRPLIYWKDGPEGIETGKWIADEGEDRRRAFEKGDL